MSTAPTPWTQLHSFTSFEAANPTSPKPGAQLDAELAAGRLTTAQIAARLAEIQRTDGKLANGSVHPDAFSSAAIALMSSANWTVRGAWLTATAYAIGDLVSQSGGSYVAATVHTSGVFATDLAAAKWVPISAALAASNITVSPAGGIAATTAQAALEELDSEKLAKASNLSDLASAAVARNNLLAHKSASIFGLAVTNNSGTPNSRVDFATGECLSADGTAILVATTAMTKILQGAGAWAAGTGQNGLFTGAVATSTTYHCFAIRKDSDGSVDFGFDTSITAANKPAGYTAYRRLWSIVTDGSGNIRKFIPDGDFCFWSDTNAPIADLSGGGVSATWTNLTLTVPSGIKVLAFGYFQNGGGSANQCGAFGLRSPAASDGDPASVGAWQLSNALSSSSDILHGAWGPVQTDTSGRIQYRSSASSPQLAIGTRGYIDQRRI